MTVQNTYEWLVAHYEQPEKICEHFTEHLPLSPREIYAFLLSWGMYRPYEEGREELKKLVHLYRTLQREFASIRVWLNGPNIPVYLLPSNIYNRSMEREYNGKSGLALSSCIFLFASSRNTDKEMQAMLTHEYHHVCRLHASSSVEECTLLESMIMEGLAEAAVRERHGYEWHAPWVFYYTKEECVRYWNLFLKQSCHIKKGETLHDRLLIGSRGYPRMLGYGVGFHIVQDCIQREHVASKQLLTMNAMQVLQYAKSFPLSIE
ncbi:DUF2268 domain-containing protein [Ectobacillus sp. sgz5001026]|uniref:DUF2268 domain-containing protein n=1 Tax=Ectobacillus sp. sgz5001026 TaxID=3242473 RepID=UPI0036D27240